MPHDYKRVLRELAGQEALAATRGRERRRRVTRSAGRRSARRGLMGELGAFLQIERHEIPERDPASARTTTTSSCSRPADGAARAGRALHGVRRALLPQRLPARQPDPRLERPRLPRPLERRDRAAARDEQLPRVHRPPLPGALRGGVRARDPRGRRGDDQADRARDHRPRLGGGLGHPEPRAAARDRPGGRRRRLRPGGHGRRPAAAPGRPPRDPVRARRGDRRPRALRRAGLQDREDGRRAPRRAARRRGRRAALRRRRRARRERATSCAAATTRSCSRPARACPATCPCPAAELDGVHFAMDYLYQRNRFVARELGPEPHRARAGARATRSPPPAETWS